MVHPGMYLKMIQNWGVGCLVVWQPRGAPATPDTTRKTPQLCVYVLGLLILRCRTFLTDGPRRLHLHVRVKSWGGGGGVIFVTAVAQVL